MGSVGATMHSGEDLEAVRLHRSTSDALERKPCGKKLWGNPDNLHTGASAPTQRRTHTTTKAHTAKAEIEGRRNTCFERAGDARSNTPASPQRPHRPHNRSGESQPPFANPMLGRIVRFCQPRRARPLMHSPRCSTRASPRSWPSCSQRSAPPSLGRQPSPRCASRRATPSQPPAPQWKSG